ncbi:MAG: right-handed parallel beta-helix repeat-containing protein [Clostridiales bacterium]|nr:right-handed parallel beta-helix repeat-containing protein [Clostridiales bacterium]
MKKFISALSALALTLSLAACSQDAAGETTVIATAVPAETTAVTVPVQDGVYTVSTVDEFIAAIGSDREIRLEEGTYDLSTASTYAGETGNEWCYWEEVYDGYELVIQFANNLTITGAGKGVTILSAAPRYAQVLRLNSCRNVSMTGFTAGHTVEPGSCVGGVVSLDFSSAISIRDVGLYGCGVVGVYTDGCDDLSIANSDIYECSYNGIQLVGSHHVDVVNCRFYDLGKTEEWPADAVFNMDSSSDITISDCEIYDNLSQYFVRSSGVDEVVLKNNVFRGNWAQESAFGTFGNFVTLDGNTFEDCWVYRWFSDGCGAVDAEGNSITEDTMNGLIPAETVPDGPKTTVTVTNADEFLAAIGPNTEIVIDAETIDFSTAKDYGGGPKKYYRWEDIYDGPALVIAGADNLTIRSKDGKTKNHTISAVPRYANVLTFLNCDNLVLSGFTAGHTKEPGVCAGGVLMFQGCTMVSVDNCGLFGCGILGVQAEGCTSITLRKCDIYECSNGGVSMSDTTGITIEKCTFRDLGGNNLMLYGCSDVTVDGKPINGQNYNGR